MENRKGIQGTQGKLGKNHFTVICSFTVESDFNEQTRNFHIVHTQVNPFSLIFGSITDRDNQGKVTDVSITDPDGTTNLPTFASLIIIHRYY
jgi:hypothetical protein